MDYYEYFKSFVSPPALSHKTEPEDPFIVPPAPHPTPEPEPANLQEAPPTKPDEVTPADTSAELIFAKAPKHIKNRSEKPKSLSLKQVVKPRGTKKNLLKKYPALQKL